MSSSSKTAAAEFPTDSADSHSQPPTSGTQAEAEASARIHRLQTTKAYFSQMIQRLRTQHPNEGTRLCEAEDDTREKYATSTGAEEVIEVVAPNSESVLAKWRDHTHNTTNLFAGDVASFNYRVLSGIEKMSDQVLNEGVHQAALGLSASAIPSSFFLDYVSSSSSFPGETKEPHPPLCSFPTTTQLTTVVPAANSLGRKRPRDDGETE